MPEFPVLELITVITGALAALFGGATSSDFFVRLLVKLLKTRIGERMLSSPEDHLRSSALELVDTPGIGSNAHHVNVDKAVRHLRTRMGKAIALRKKFFIESFVSRWSARAFTFGQFIVGGALTIEFVKEMFSPKTIGVLGVIVFVISGMNQRFNPAANAEMLLQKSEQLDVLILSTEDKILEIETTTDFSNDDAKPILMLVKKVTAEISRINSLSRRRKQSGKN